MGQADQDKFSPRIFLECVRDRSNNNILKAMSSADFDSDLFCLTIKLFKWYNVDTKLLLLSFFKVLIEEADLNNPDDFK